MRVGAINAYGANRTAYPARIDAVKRLNPVDLTQRSARIIKPETQRKADTGIKPDFSAVNLIRNNAPLPSRVKTYSLDEFKFGGSVSREPRDTSKKAADEKAADKTYGKTNGNNGGFTPNPAQQRGIEAYMRAQNYANYNSALNVSAASIAV